MKKGGKGGSQTQTGLLFEQRVSLKKLFTTLPGYQVSKLSEAGHRIYYNGKLVAKIFRKGDFYKFLEEEGIDWKTTISRKLYPDDALLVIVRDTLFIIEVKFQKVQGSVDEKLQTCDFKRKQYVKLTQGLGLRIEYVYVLNDFFKDPKYRDVLDYVQSVNCHYVFNEVPLSWFGLPS